VRLGSTSLGVALLSSCLICPACTTTSQVSLRPSPSASQLALEPGRKALIHLRSGAELRGTIVEADDNSLTLLSKSGSIKGIAFEDMESLKTSRLSMKRTAAAIGGGLLGAFGAWYLIMERAHADDQ
jgi:hypothetical protein